jgi:hypothetical protein
MTEYTSSEMDVISQDVADDGHKYLYMCGINILTHSYGFPAPTPAEDQPASASLSVRDAPGQQIRPHTGQALQDQ